MINEKLKELLKNAEKVDGLLFIKERIANREQLRKEKKRKIERTYDKRNKTNGS